MAIKIPPNVQEKLLGAIQKTLSEPPVDPSTPPWEDHIPMATNQGAGAMLVELVNNKEKTSVIAKQDLTVVPAGPLIPKDKLASVMVGGAMTVNLGNYQSAKVTVHLSIPAHIDGIDEAYEKASDWVSEKIKKAVSDVQGTEPSEEHL